MKYLSFFAVLVFIIIPIVSSAAGFIPCDGSSANGGTACTECHFVQMGNTILKWLIGVLFAVFAVVAAIGGFGLVTSGGNPEAMNEAKSKLVNALIGLIIVLAAWLLVDTVMRGVLSSGTDEITGYGPWSEVKCGTVAKTETSMDYLTVAQVNGVATPSGNAAVAGAGMTQVQAVADLKAANVIVKGDAKLEGIKPHVISSIAEFNKNMLAACPGCKPVTITEGTGGTHASGDFSHANGFKLDLRTYDNPGMVKYIKDTYAPAGTWKDGTPLYYDAKKCATYAIEGDHVDVVYKTGC